jgi:hypothetical protein
MYLGPSDVFDARFSLSSAFFRLADLQVFSCCLVFLGALPAAAVSGFFQKKSGIFHDKRLVLIIKQLK